MRVLVALVLLVPFVGMAQPGVGSGGGPTIGGAGGVNSNQVYQIVSALGLTSPTNGQTAVQVGVQIASSNLAAKFTASAILYVDINGNDGTAVRGRIDKPYRTLMMAVSNATSGSTIFLNPGTYFCYSNTFVLPDNVNLVGSGAELFGFNDLADDGYDPTHPGVMLVPGNNSIISGITITCDTNTMALLASEGHDGYWAAFGTKDSYVTPHQASGFTNVTVIGMKILHGTTDALYFKGNTLVQAKFYSCDIYSGWDVLASLGNTIDVDFFGCSFTIDGASVPWQPEIGVVGTFYNLAQISNTGGHIGFYGCRNTITNVTTIVPFQINDGAKLKVTVEGGEYIDRQKDGTIVSAFPAYTNFFGSFLLNGTNVIFGPAAYGGVYEFALSDETTAITTGAAKVSWRAPFAMTLIDVRASLSTVSSSGIPTVNIKEAGTTIFSTKLTIDANELTSTTAAVPYVFSDTTIADDALVTFDIDVAGTGAAGLKVKLYYTR